MTEVTLKQLRYALALDECRHFGQAARQCHVTQPALSQQIKQLEEYWGRPLFERRGRAVVPTPVGSEMLSQARQVLHEVTRLQDLASGHTGLPNHPVRFGLIPTVAPYLLPDAYPALRKAFPAIAFQISENQTDILITQLSDNLIDLALIATEPPDRIRFLSQPLFDDPFVLAVASTSSLNCPVDLTAIAKDRILLLNEGHCFRDQAIEVCALRNSDRRRNLAATSLSTIVEFVANDQGITLLPSISLRKEAANERIRVLPLPDASASRRLNLVWRQASPFTDFFKALAEIMVQTAPVRPVLAQGAR